MINNMRGESMLRKDAEVVEPDHSTIKFANGSSIKFLNDACVEELGSIWGGYNFDTDSYISGEVMDDISRSHDNSPQLSLAARILVSQVGSYNGHSQLEVRDKLSLEEITSLLEELTTYYTRICINWSVYCVMESDGSGSFHIRDYWDDDNPGKVKGEKDKLLFSFGGV